MGVVTKVHSNNLLESMKSGKPAPWIFEAPEGKQPGLIRDYKKEMAKYTSQVCDGIDTLFQGGKEVLLKEDIVARILEAHIDDKGTHRTVTCTTAKVQERFVCYNLLKWVKETLAACDPCNPGVSGGVSKPQADMKEKVMPDLADKLGLLQAAIPINLGQKGRFTRSKVKHVMRTVTTTTSYKYGNDTLSSCESVSPFLDVGAVGDVGTPVSSVAQPNRGRPRLDAEMRHAGVLTRFWAEEMECVTTTRGHNFVIHLHCQGTRTVFAIAHANNSVAAYAQAIGQHVLGYPEGEREVVLPKRFSPIMSRGTVELVETMHVPGTIMPTFRQAPDEHPENGVCDRLTKSVRRSFIANSDQYALDPIEPKYWDRLLPLVTRVINLDSDSLAGAFPYNKAYRVSPFDLDDIERDSDDDF